MTSNSARSAFYPFLKRYVYVASLDRVFDRETKTYITVRAACRLHGNEVSDGVCVEHVLLRGPHAVDKVDGVTFWPGQPEIVIEDGAKMLNRWSPVALQPQSGRIWPFMRHLNLIVDGDAIAIQFVLDYFAHLVQHPEVKIQSALLFIGLPGTGKSMLARVAAQMVGVKNVKSVPANQLCSDFNGWMGSTSLTVVDEMESDKPRSTTARLNSWITEDKVYINEKGIPGHEVRNRNHFILLSNSDQAVSVRSNDRRFFVWRSEARPQRLGYYRWLAKWLAGGGYARILDQLQRRNIARFDPCVPPPRTASRAGLASESRSEIEAYLGDALEASEPPFDRELVVCSHICDYLSQFKHITVGPKVVAGVLRSAGAVELGQKRVGRVKPRLWAVRNKDFWSNASEWEIAEYYSHSSEPVRGLAVSSAQPLRRRRPVNATE